MTLSIIFSFTSGGETNPRIEPCARFCASNAVGVYPPLNPSSVILFLNYIKTFEKVIVNTHFEKTAVFSCDFCDLRRIFAKKEEQRAFNGAALRNRCRLMIFLESPRLKNEEKKSKKRKHFFYYISELILLVCRCFGILNLYGCALYSARQSEET